VLFLDVQNRLLAMEELFRGTLTQTSVYPREVVLRALHHQASPWCWRTTTPAARCSPAAPTRP
jgi:DNA repair protein RadC